MQCEANSWFESKADFDRQVRRCSAAVPCGGR